MKIYRNIKPTKNEIDIYINNTDVKRIERPINLRFGKIAACTDADLDGSHIKGLLQNLFYTFWPELFDLGVISFFKTPLVKIWIEGKKKEEKWFYNEDEYTEWLKDNGDVKHKMKWYKGLGTSSAAEFSEYLNKMVDHLITLSIKDISDSDAIDLAFSRERADDRKEWLNIT